MSSGKGKRRTKGTTLALSTFLGGQKNAPHGYTVCNIDWAEAMEKEELDDKADMKQLVLPTAPKAARGLDIDMDDIPSKPPFTAYVGNLPYEVTEEDITRFFRDLKVSSVRIPRESGDKGRIRGFGYAEFADRQSLILALEKNNESMKNRSIKVSLATEHNKDGDGDRKDERSDRTVGDWRAGPREESFQGRDGYDRGGMSDREPYQGRSSYGNSNGRYERNDRGMSNDRDFERGSSYGGDWGGERRQQGGDRYGDRDRGFGGDRDRGFGGDRDRDRGFGGNRDRGFDSSDRGYDRGGQGGGGRREYGSNYRDSYDRRRDDYPPRDQGSFERRTESRDEMDAPKERPKLNLKPRSVAKEPSESGTNASSSIFGGAKPVDTAAREREIEDRLVREKQEHERSAPGDRKPESSQRRSGPPRSRQSSESGPPSNFRNSLSEDDSLPPPKAQTRNDDRQSNARSQQKSGSESWDRDGPPESHDTRPPSDHDSGSSHDGDRESSQTNGSLPRESAARRARSKDPRFEGETIDNIAPVEYKNKFSKLTADEDELHEGSASD